MRRDGCASLSAVAGCRCSTFSQDGTGVIKVCISLEINSTAIAAVCCRCRIAAGIDSSLVDGDSTTIQIDVCAIGAGRGRLGGYSAVRPDLE